MAARIAKEAYKADEMVTFKLPFIQPYAPLDGKFEAASGLIEHDGQFYRLIKQKLEADTLYVVAIKDVGEKMVSGYISDFVKNSSAASDTKAFKLISEFTKDYVASAAILVVSRNGWSYDLAPTLMSASFLSIDNFVETPPPDTAQLA